MIVYGLRINYDGDFGDLPVLQAGPYKVIAVRRYLTTPAGLIGYFNKAEKEGIQFLVIDQRPLVRKGPEFIDIPTNAQRIAA